MTYPVVRAAAFVIALAGLLCAEDAANAKGVSFDLAYKRDYESNLMIVSMRVTGMGLSLAGSMQRANSVSDDVAADLSKAGIKKDEVSIIKGKSYPSSYSLFGKAKKFESQSVIEIKTKRYEIINTVSDLLEKKEDELHVMDISFSHDNLDSLGKVFVSEAMKKVLESKSNYESSLGMALKVCSVSEENEGRNPFVDDEYGGKSFSKKSGSRRKEGGFTGFSSSPKLEYTVNYRVYLCQ